MVRVARWSAEHRWRPVLAWMAFVAVCVGVGGAVGRRSQSDADAAVDPDLDVEPPLPAAVGTQGAPVPVG